MSLCSREFELVKCGLKLFLQSLWSFYSNNFKEIYKFCVILMYRLGFDVEEEFHLNNTDILQNDTLLSNSLSVLAEVFAVLSELNCSCDSTVNEISFTNFLKTILLSIMNLTQTPTDVYSIMINIFVINPLIAEQLMSEISIYLMVKPTVSLETKEDHEKLLTHIFQIFAKLHRIEKLIAIMAIALKSGFEGSHKSEKALYFFCGQNDLTGKSATESTLDVVLSDSVLHCLSQHITVLANWQVINVFKSFLYHLNAALDSINKGEFRYFKDQVTNPQFFRRKLCALHRNIRCLILLLFNEYKNSRTHANVAGKICESYGRPEAFPCKIWSLSFK